MLGFNGSVGSSSITGTTVSVLLICALLAVAFDGAEVRTRRGDRIPRLSKPEQQADALLKEWLSPEQRSTLHKYGFFELRGSQGRAAVSHKDGVEQASCSSKAGHEASTTQGLVVGMGSDDEGFLLANRLTGLSAFMTLRAKVIAWSPVAIGNSLIRAMPICPDSASMAECAHPTVGSRGMN